LAADGSAEPPYFFISRATEDAAVAREVADVIRSHGCGVLYQDEHIPHGSNFVSKMDEFLGRCQHLVVIMSDPYVQSSWCKEEWTNFYADKIGTDPTRHLAVIRIGNCTIPPMLRAYVRATLEGVTSAPDRRSVILAATRVQHLVNEALGHVQQPGSVTPATTKHMAEALLRFEKLKLLRSQNLIGNSVAEELERELARDFLGL
jgi:hypothetical protein